MQAFLSVCHIEKVSIDRKQYGGYSGAVDLTPYRTPGQLITALLSERGWTQRVLGMGDPAVAKMVNDKRAIDAEVALQLSEVFALPHARRHA